MSQGRPRLFSPAQCAELWHRYKAGESILGIGRFFCGRHSAIHRVLQSTGGIAPLPRRRSARVLSLVEREEISRGIAAGCTIRGHCQRFEPPRLYREPGSAPAWRPTPLPSLQRRLESLGLGTSSKAVPLARNQLLQRIVAVKLKEDWAPQQIAGWLKQEYPENPELWVSHETIYRSLFVQARGALKKELIGHLRSKRRIRRSRNATYKGTGRAQIVDAISIRHSPAEVEDRAVPGHWEGDLVEGSRGTYIATLVERHSRFVIIVKVNDKRTEVIVAALIKAIRKLPAALRRSLTWDRGAELPITPNLP